MDIPTLTLNDGHAIPAIGFGTYPLRGEEGVEAMVSAMRAGYRLIDSAVNYQNETEVGEAIRQFTADSGVSRDELTIQTKLPGRHHDYDLALESIGESLERLGLDRIDVMLIHWPNPSVGKFTDAWRALVDARERGMVRSVGVSNFTAEHLDAIVDDTGVTPALNQIELHPYFSQAQMRAEHAGRGIITQSWSPLGKRDAPYNEPVIAGIAADLGVTPVQVVLRWQIQLGNLPVPKSANPERQAQNLDVFGFELAEAEMAAISGLTKEDGRLFGGDPEVHEEM